MHHRLRNVSVAAISIVRKGANNKRIFLFKSGEDETEPIASGARIIKGDWNAFYAVVAEPEWMERPGMVGDQSINDVWDSEEEIRKTAHGFLKNGGLINKMHESMEPFGKLVESAVALDDFKVGDETIKKGSWYVAIEPTDEGKQLIDSGEFTGISIEGHGDRVLTKADDGDDFDALDTMFFQLDGEPIHKGRLERVPGVQNWVDEVGGLPDLIDRAAVHIHEKGASISAAIATAVNWAKKMCATGTAWGGKVRVSAGAQARACAAVADWERKKAQARLTKMHVPKGTDPATVPESVEVVEEYLAKVAIVRDVDAPTKLQKIKDFLTGDDVLSEGNNDDSATLEDEMDEAKVNELVKSAVGEAVGELKADLDTKIADAVKESQTEVLAKLDELKPASEQSDEKADPAKLSERVEEVAQAVSDANDSLVKLSADVDALATGQKSEDGPDDADRTVQKSDNPLAGLLS